LRSSDGTEAGQVGPLAGLVVCDVSTVLAGPWCTMLLGDLGADVIKVEPPDGDPTRGYGPPFAGDQSTYFLAANRNKRDIRLDLKKEPGRDVLRRLIARSDVLVENFRPGGLARLGFPDAELERLNPRLVHLAITGYGPDGPDANLPGFDFVIQAAAGLMSITGDPEEGDGRPVKVGVAIADLAAGMLGAVAVLAALLARAESRQGQRIDLSVLEASVSWLANQATSYLVGGVVPRRMGNHHPNITPYETFATADGEIAVAVGSERQWRRLCEALGDRELASDRRFATNAARVEHRAALRPLLEDHFRGRTSAEWLSALRGAEVPAGAINDIAAVFADPQVLARRMVETVAHSTLGPVRLPGIPFKFSATPASVRTAPPLLGEQTDEILAWLGYDAAAVRTLRSDGTV
jgi:crotonobetainyl-CoA:carnitine CoA-transferase CaiB-like acyl-CoA transferase